MKRTLILLLLAASTASANLFYFGKARTLAPMRYSQGKVTDTVWAACEMWWPFDRDDTGVYYDYGPDSVDGTEGAGAAAPTWTAKTISCDGGDYADTGETFQTVIRGSHSISMWVKPDDGIPAGLQVPFGMTDDASNEYYLYVNTAGKLCWYFEAGGNLVYCRTDAAFFANGAETWHHIVAVADTTIGGAGGMKWYADGNALTIAAGDGDTSGITFGDFTSDSDIYVGARNDVRGTEVDQHFAGDIDDVLPISSALSSNQVVELYNIGRSD